MWICVYVRVRAASLRARVQCSSALGYAGTEGNNVNQSTLESVENCFGWSVAINFVSMHIADAYTTQQRYFGAHYAC